ncbi:MAG: prolipoprotein diacylglyceryl transferase family protein [Thermoanaerobaculia bacterium]
MSPAPRALAALGEALTRRVRPRILLAGRIWPVYGVCVCSGAVLAAAWMVALAAVSGAPPLLALAVAAAGIAGSLALAYLTRAVLGTERFTFYHYQLAILATGGAVVAWAGGPALTCLDVLAVGLAVVQAVGRLGCLGAGCCHGRAVPWGVRYGHEHADDGFPHRLVGVALAPVQAFESLALFALAAGGSVLVIAGREPGSALALYMAGYATARFFLERWRGDSRPSFAGLSEAQWTALAALAAVTALGAAGRLPLGRAGVAAGLALLLLLAAGALADRSRQAGGLLSGAHWTETAALLSRLTQREERPVEVRATSRRLHLSTGLVEDAGRLLRLVSFSTAGPPLAAPAASRLARRLSRHLGAGGRGELRRGERGVWHLLVPLTSNAEGA